MPRSVTLAVAAAGSLAAACSSTPVSSPSRDLDRPVDMVFTCLGVHTPPDGGTGGAASIAGYPMDFCHPAPDIEDMSFRTFAFVPNSASGLLAVIDADRSRLVDLDPAVGGYNQAPLGVLPEQIAASDDGCRLVTANRGSCDLTLVDPAALLAPSFKLSGAPPTQTITVTAGGAPIRSAPQEVAFLPQDTVAIQGGGNGPLCGADDTPPSPPNGWTEAANPRSWEALVTFPSCDLIALVDLPSGAIRDSVKVVRSGASLVAIQPQGANPVCPADCGPERGLPLPDGGSAGDGGADAGAPVGPASRLLPGPIAIVPGGTRAYVGLASTAYIVVLDLQDGHLTAAREPISLTDGALGVSRLRLSVDAYAQNLVNMQRTGKLGKYAGDSPDRHYLYAIARDGTVRVVHMSEVVADQKECETNVDPQRLPAGSDPNNPCFPASPDYRRPGAVGPGIRLFGNVPIDVAVADIKAPADVTSTGPPRTKEGTVSGTYAWMLASNGASYLVNINPVLRQYSIVAGPEAPPTVKVTDETAPLANSLRDRNVVTYTRLLDATSGPPRLDLAPAVPPTGPRIEPIYERGTENNATALTGDWIPTYVAFPNPKVVTPQTWSVSWEGALLGQRFSGQVSDQTGDTFSLEDRGLSFCALGIQPGDLMTLTGCTSDGDCGLGKVCLTGEGNTQAVGGLVVTGICGDPLKRSALESACAGLLTTVRRYEITDSKQMILTLRPHKDEVVRSRLQRCDAPGAGSGGGGNGGDDGGGTTGDGGVASDGGSGDGGAASPFDLACRESTDPSTARFQCISGRCLMRCETDTDCRAGRSCVAFAPGSTDILGSDPCAGQKCCADGPVANVGCFPELTTYFVSAGRSYLVQGSRTGVPVAGTSMADGTCVPKDLTPQLVKRISLDAQECPSFMSDPAGLDSRCLPKTETDGCKAVSDALTSIQRTSQPVPCLFRGGGNETDPAETSPLSPNPQPSPPHTRVLFRNAEIELIMTNLEKAPPGRLDIRFDVHGGFQPDLVAPAGTVELTMPARLIVGPTTVLAADPAMTANKQPVPYLFVVDQRRLGRTQGGGPTRGQILRIHPFGLSTSTVQRPLFDDLQTSQGLFPIQ